MKSIFCKLLLCQKLLLLYYVLFCIMPAKFLSNLFLNLILSLVTLKGRREQKQKIVSFPNLFCCLTLLHTEKLPPSSADFENFCKIKMSMFSWLINIHYLTFIYIILFASNPSHFAFWRRERQFSADLMKTLPQQMRNQPVCNGVQPERMLILCLNTAFKEIIQASLWHGTQWSASKCWRWK